MALPVGSETALHGLARLAAASATLFSTRTSSTCSRSVKLHANRVPGSVPSAAATLSRHRDLILSRDRGDHGTIISKDDWCSSVLFVVTGLR